MESRLVPINAMIALLSRRTTSWPSSLHDAGYTLVGLEMPLDTLQGRFTADLVAFNDDTNTFLLIECKSGKNIKPDQATRYSKVNALQLVHFTDVTIATDSKLSTETLYACLAENRKRILQGLTTAKCPYPVISVGSDRLTLDANGSSSPVTSVLCTPIRVTSSPPISIRVDELSVPAEFHSIAAQALINELTRGINPISVPDLAGRALPHLHMHGTRSRRKLISKFQDAAKTLCDVAPETLRFRIPTATRDYAIIDVADSPEAADPRGRTQRYQAIWRKFSGLPADRQQPTQQATLFDSIALDAEMAAVEAAVDFLQGSQTREGYPQ